MAAVKLDTGVVVGDSLQAGATAGRFKPVAATDIELGLSVVCVKTEATNLGDVIIL